MKWLVVLGASCFGIHAIAGVGPAEAQEYPASFEKIVQSGKNAESARGVWRSRGYGWIVVFKEASLEVYHVSRGGCSKDPRTDNFAEQFAYRAEGGLADVMTIVSYPGESRYVFDRLSDLPSICTRSAWTPARLFDHFVSSYREQYAFFNEREISWEARARAQRKLITERTSGRVLFALFSDMLDGLEDAHVSLNATYRGEQLQFRTGRGRTLLYIQEEAARTRQSPVELRSRWLKAYRNGIRETILGGKFQEAGNDRFVWGRIGADIGYINLTGLDGFAPGPLADNIAVVEAVMERILVDFNGVEAIILDVTNNTGGYDRMARDVAGRFAATRTLAYTKRPFNAPGAPVDVFYAEPSTGSRFTGPVFLVTSDVTVSAGEILTMTMRVLPNVTQVGTRTRGALSDRLTKVLANGVDFSISNEIYLDPTGTLFEAVGVPPHRALEVFPLSNLDSGHARAISQLTAQIRAGTAGRETSP